MKQSSKDKAKGTYHALKGNVKQRVGSLTNNPRLEGEGLGEKVAGKVQKAISKIEKVLEKP